jgi:GDPmannose 4,6-dehydratase
LFATNGILFNHESPRRGETFVTRKIVRAAVEIKLGLRKHISLGNLDAKRDWGYAPEFVGAMWRMLNHDQPADFVIATGQETTVREFAQQVFSRLDLTFEEFATFDERLLRPSEVDALVGDFSKAEKSLGWAPKVFTSHLVEIMVEEEMRAIQSGVPFLDVPRSWGSGVESSP